MMNLSSGGKSAVDLAALLADPVAAKARLEALTAATAEFQKAADELRAAQAEAKVDAEKAAADRAAAEEARDAASSMAANTGATMDAARTQQDVADRKAREQRDALDAERKDFEAQRTAWKAAVAAREIGLMQREANVAATENQTAIDAKAAADLRETYERKVAALKTVIDE